MSVSNTSPEQLEERATANLNRLAALPAPVKERLQLLLEITEVEGRDIGEILGQDILDATPVNHVTDLTSIHGIGPMRLRRLIEALGRVDLDALLAANDVVAGPEPAPAPPLGDMSLVSQEQTRTEPPSPGSKQPPARAQQVLPNALRLAADTLIVPGTSLVLNGELGPGALHAVAGVAARALLGPVGWLIVAANSYAKSTTGSYLIGGKRDE